MEPTNDPVNKGSERAEKKGSGAELEKQRGYMGVMSVAS
jgi:hypothetical protein